MKKKKRFDLDTDTIIWLVLIAINLIAFLMYTWKIPYDRAMCHLLFVVLFTTIMFCSELRKEIMELKKELEKSSKEC